MYVNTMTPAIHAAKKAGIEYTVHEYEHDPNADSYGLEAAAVLGIDTARVFKTLLVSLHGGAERLAVGIVPVASQLDLKAIAAVAGAKKAGMADPQLAERVTGYILGGISPLGQKKRLATFIDESITGFATVFVSAGRRGLEIELAPDDLQALCHATLVKIKR
jgi:Cys-tRNA(Pro)/Cys-tRNA(Cys) deacylase